MFGSDPQIVGKTIRFAEFPTTVVGVAPRDLDFPHDADFWMKCADVRDDLGHGNNAIVRMKAASASIGCAANYRA